MNSQVIAAATGSACSQSGGKQYNILPTSQVSWKVNRFKVASGDLIPFTGSNALLGGFGITNGNLSTAKGIFTTLIDSTESGDSLRDDRIVGYLFRLGSPEFKMEGFKEKDLILEEGRATPGTVYGTLSVAGQSTSLEVPVTIIRNEETVTVSTANPVLLNLRKISPTNGLDLSKSIAHLLTLVNGIEIKDEIEISLNLGLDKFCSGPGKGE